MRSLSTRSSSRALILALLGAIPLAEACSGHSGAPTPSGQTDFTSAPFAGQTSGSGGGGGFASASAGAASAPAANTSSSTPRTVQETDLYRLDGNRLYYLNSYRGLMVFDVTNVDQPKFLGRSAIFGSPVDMIVQNGIATVVVGDWYGSLDDGSPFHGSIVRGLDATDPTNIKVLGDAKLGGWVQEDRVVGTVLYAVSEDYGWTYGWGGGPVVGGGGIAFAGAGVALPASSSGPNVIVSSVNFAGGKVTQVASHTYTGNSAVFNVTANSIMLARPVAPGADAGYAPATKTGLQYLDISDPGGQIVDRGSLQVDGIIDTSGADNGRWNLDFADGKTAHTIGCGSGQYGCGGTQGSYVLATADFSNPDAPVLDSELTIPATGWNVSARFDSGRMYLSPDGTYYVGGTTASSTTPLQVYDLSNPAMPALAGQAQIPGSVWLMVPSGNQLFALGSSQAQNSSQVSLNYLDVSLASKPTLIGTSTFGEGWASTPASSTFKAFTYDPNQLGTNQGMVVLPFSGWDAANSAYNNGVQLIEFTPTSITTGGAAHTHGWVERGIFANGRIVSLSDLALSVVDYTNPLAPNVTAELTLARSVVAAQPGGTTIAEVSSDWWDNDLTHSDVRVLPVADAEENRDESNAPDATVAGVGATVFNNGNFEYIVTNVQVPVPCGSSTGVGAPGVGAAPSLPAAGGKGSVSQQCNGWQEQVQVVDLSNGGAKLRGKIALPMAPNGYYSGWGWYGCYYYDWYNGADVVQVGATTLAFRRWDPAPQGKWVDGASDLYVVDLSNPDSPGIASLVITDDPAGWWGNMRVVGDTLYTSHYEWLNGPVAAGVGVAQGGASVGGAAGVSVGVANSASPAASPGASEAIDAGVAAADAQPAPMKVVLDAGIPVVPDAGVKVLSDADGVVYVDAGTPTSPPQPTVRYYLDRIDLSDPKNPKIGSKINVPGALVGGSASDPTTLYTMDYAWDSNVTRDTLDVVKIDGDLAYLQSKTELDGWVGKVIVQGTTAYMTTQVYSDKLQAGQPSMELHQIDLSNPKAPVDRVASGMGGWGWLLDVQGDRALVTSGWGSDGLDIYRLSPSAAPVYDQFVRTRGYDINSLSRQNNQIFLSSGYWGVQAVTLQ